MLEVDDCFKVKMEARDENGNVITIFLLRSGELSVNCESSNVYLVHVATDTYTIPFLLLQFQENLGHRCIALFELFG